VHTIDRPADEEGEMDDARTHETLSDEDIRTVMSGEVQGSVLELRRDADGTDTQDADGTDTQDADGTDTQDADGTDTQDADGTDTQDADGTDSQDADGTDR
jgi:hypothetical protein